MPKKVVINEIDERIDEEAKGKKTKAPISIKQAYNICQGYIDEIKRAEKYREDSPTARESLYETIDEITNQNTQIGDDIDFHNLSAKLGGNGFDELACVILDCALERFPMNVDLLADYLIYGISCERFDKCSKHFETLESIEKNMWTWRCFAFSITYFIKLRDNFATSIEQRNIYKKKITSLAKAYKKYLPYEEGGYKETAKLFSRKPDEMLKVLNEALANESIGACPACAFEKAEILFKRKDYKGALNAINRSLEDCVNQTRGGVKENYLLFLRGLCNYAELLKEKHLSESELETVVLSIYSDFNKALRDIDDSHIPKIRTRTMDLLEDTQIRIPDDMDRLVLLVE